MVTEQNKELARWAVEFALKNGCQAVRINCYTSSNTSFELRDAKMDRLQQASENGMSLTYYVDGRYGSYSTNRLIKTELESFIKNGIEATRYLAVDEARSLPDPSRYYKGGKPDLQLFDAKIDTVNPDEKVAYAKAAGDEAIGKDPRIISVESAYGDGSDSEYIIMSNGFTGERNSSWCSLSASVSIKGEGEARPSDYWYDSSLYIDKMIKEGIGQKALERVLRKLGQKKIQSGKYTMIVDPMNGSRLVSPMVGALYGSALQQRNSFLLDKIGEKVGGEKFTLIDDPHIPQAAGARYFDNEGVATEKRAIFENGVLKTYFIDTYNANKMNIAPTVSNPSLLVLQPGERDLAAILKGIDRGILVTGFNGGNNNSSTGDFSYGVEGFLVEKGELTQPLSEMNITGNLITLWNSLAEVGNDPRLSSSWRIPSLVFEGVDFSGL